MPEPSIKTTVVSSHPIPSRLAVLPSSASLRDTILVASKTQELAGPATVTDRKMAALVAGRNLFLETP